MEIGKSYDVDVNKRQFRQRFSMSVYTRIEIPETHEWRIVDINLGGMGMGIPLLIEEGDSRDEIIARNSFSISVQESNMVYVRIYDEKFFTEPFEATLEVQHVQSTGIWYGMPLVHFVGGSFKNLSDQKFWQLEKVFMRAKRGQ